MKKGPIRMFVTPDHLSNERLTQETSYTNIVHKHFLHKSIALHCSLAVIRVALGLGLGLGF
jgi:hypothetical protein